MILHCATLTLSPTPPRQARQAAGPLKSVQLHRSASSRLYHRMQPRHWLHSSIEPDCTINTHSLISIHMHPPGWQPQPIAAATGTVSCTDYIPVLLSNPPTCMQRTRVLPAPECASPQAPGKLSFTTHTNTTALLLAAQPSTLGSSCQSETGRYSCSRAWSGAYAQGTS